MSKLYRRQVQWEQEEAKGLDREPGKRKAEREDRAESSEPRGRATAAALLFSGTRGKGGFVGLKSFWTRCQRKALTLVSSSSYFFSLTFIFILPLLFYSFKPTFSFYHTPLRAVTWIGCGPTRVSREAECASI